MKRKRRKKKSIKEKAEKKNDDNHRSCVSSNSTKMNEPLWDGGSYKLSIPQYAVCVTAFLICIIHTDHTDICA